MRAWDPHETSEIPVGRVVPSEPQPKSPIGDALYFHRYFDDWDGKGMSHHGMSRLMDRRMSADFCEGETVQLYWVRAERQPKAPREIIATGHS